MIRIDLYRCCFSISRLSAFLMAFSVLQIENLKQFSSVLIIMVKHITFCFFWPDSSKWSRSSFWWSPASFCLFFFYASHGFEGWDTGMLEYMNRAELKNLLKLDLKHCLHVGVQIIWQTNSCANKEVFDIIHSAEYRESSLY